MAHVVVHGADLSGDRISQLRVAMHKLPARTLSRDEVVSWMRDGHSFLLKSGAALQLVDLGDGEFSVRLDNAKVAADAVEGVASVSSAGV